MVRTRDFSATPLGPRDLWPEPLRITTSILLESPVPMALVWGRELVLLYNDAYRRIAADQHPRALGRPVREVPQIWEREAEVRAAVLERGESVLLEDQRVALERDGLREDAYFTLSYSPVRAHHGGIAGCLLTALETTYRVRGEAEHDHRALDALAQRERQFRSLIENVYSAVALVDAEGRFTLYNARFRELFGIADDADIDNVNSHDWSAWEVVDENGRLFEVHEHPVRMAALTREPVKNCVVGVRSPGAAERRWMLVSAAPLLSDHGALEQLICTYHDITDLKRAQERLTESEERFRTMANAIPQLAWIARGDGTIYWFNDRWYAFTGTTPEEMQDGSGWVKSHDPAALPRITARWKAAVATGEPLEMETSMRGASGRFRRFLTRVLPLKDEQGRVLQWFATHTDITDLAEAQAELRRERDFSAAVVDLARALVMVVDRDGRVLRFNRACEQTSGYRASELVGRHHSLLLAPGERPISALGGSGRTEQQWVAKDRSRRLIAWSNTVVTAPEGSVEFVVGTGLDVTEQRRTEEALRRANEQLLEADRRKNEFMAVLSHELRNPLAPIRNSVYILEHADVAGERAERARKVIDRQVRHMTRLVEDLLDVTRISRGKITLARERVDIGALARRTAEDHRELFASNGLALEIDGEMAPLWVHGDPTRLAQVIGNLLNNSAKFTPRGGQTRLSFFANARGQAVIRVKDDGAGMSPDTLRHLFEPFMQAAQTIERTRGGLGLGLALVKGLVEMHGGSVSAYSAGEGRGSEFALTLPLETDAAAGPMVARATARRASTRRVLIIEDNVDAAESLREALELGNHEVVVAYSGPEGLEVAHRLTPDVVLCDIGLPGMDGYEVAKALRADASASLRGAFLVALSGYAQQEDVQRAKEAGFDRHAAKPLGIEALERLRAEAPPPPPPSGQDG